MTSRKIVDRRQVVQGGIALLVSLGVETLSAPAFGQKVPMWKKSPSQPVLGGDLGTCFDVCLLFEHGVYKMWFSWRPKKSIAMVTSTDGVHWSAPIIGISGLAGSSWEEDVNRPIVVKRGGVYHLWYTGQAHGRSSIGYAASSDGVSWHRVQEQPVLTASEKWEGVAVMVPHVLWETKSNEWRMWYSAGEQFEPNEIGVATSKDGVSWTKSTSNPVLRPDKSLAWEQERVTAAQVFPYRGYYYAFYIGFRDVDHAQIGIARSRDGVHDWVRNASNPIISPTPGGWDSDACYKPFVLQTPDGWVLWYNGRSGSVEQIGRAVQTGKLLQFSGDAS